MEKDKLVIEMDGVRYAFDTSDVASIVESESMPFLPGSTGFITGIISLRGDPVTVVDLRKIFDPDRTGINEEGPKRVVVVRGKNRLLGFDVGSAEISFIWEEGSGPEKGPAEGTIGEAGPCADAVRLIDWGALFDEAARILSTEGSGA